MDEVIDVLSRDARLDQGADSVQRFSGQSADLAHQGYLPGAFDVYIPVPEQHAPSVPSPSASVERSLCRPRPAHAPTRSRAREEKPMNAVRSRFGLALVLTLLAASVERTSHAEPTTQTFALLAGVPAQPAPAKPFADVSLEPTGIRFGSTTEAIAKLYDRWWNRRFVPLYRQANPGPKTRELDHRLATSKRLLRRVAHFDGVSTSFDKADFREEFAHDNRETMTWAKLTRTAPDGSSRPFTRRFFFFRDKLWKVYDEHDLGAGSPFGSTFAEAAQRVQTGLGAEAVRTRAPEGRWPSVVFDVGRERIRLLDLSGGRVAVVRFDEELARRVIDRRPPQVTEKAPVLDDSVKAVLREDDPLPAGLQQQPPANP
jgi:hypothetical protein